MHLNITLKMKIRRIFKPFDIFLKGEIKVILSFCHVNVGG